MRERERDREAATKPNALGARNCKSMRITQTKQINFSFSFFSFFFFFFSICIIIIYILCKGKKKSLMGLDFAIGFFFF